jgi:hypothetical protein
MFFVSDARANLITSSNITNNSSLANPKGLASNIGDALAFAADDSSLADGFADRTVIQFTLAPPDETNSNTTGIGFAIDAATYKSATNKLGAIVGPFVLTRERPLVGHGSVGD